MRRGTTRSAGLGVAAATALAVTLLLPISTAWAQSDLGSRATAAAQNQARKPKAAKPAITSFTATPTRIAGIGAVVKLAGKVTGATSCTFKSAESLPGLPKTTSCSSGSAQLSVKVPANTAAASRTLTFSLVATKGSSTATHSVTVLQAEEAPSLGEFSIKPSALTSSGGKVTVAFVVSRATSCELTSTPKLVGLPEKIACTSGSVHHLVAIPAGSVAASYQIVLTASGPGGTTSASGKVTRAAPPKPTVGTISADPAHLSAAGGSVSLSTPVTHATSCTYKVSPTLTGFPDTVSCANGTAAAKVTIPANDSYAAVDYKFSLSATGPGGTTASETDLTVAEAAAARPTGNPVTWSASANIEPPPNQFQLVSCPSSTFCVAGDTSSGYAAVESAGTWGTATEVTGGDGLSSLSCSTSTFCLATDGSEVYLYDGTSWTETSSPFDSEAGIAELSCAPGGSCMATDFAGDVATTPDGSTWTTVAGIPDGASATGLTCLSSDSCVALVSASGDFGTEIWDGTSWTAGGSLDITSYPSDFSCSSVSLCVTSTYDQETSSNVIELYSDGSWGAASLPVGDTFAGNLTCVVSGSCLATGLDSDASAELFAYSSGSWGAVSGSAGAPFVTGLACSSETSCTGVMSVEAYEFDGSSWSNAVIGWADDVTGLSCPTTSWCMAVDSGGNAVSYDGSDWSSPVSVTSLELLGVSCSSSSFCAAVDGAGDLLTYNDGTWTTETGLLSGFSFGGDPVSCPSSSFCVAVFGSRVAYYNGSSWSATTIDSTDADLSGVSCLSETECIAVDSSGEAFSYNGSSWSEKTIDSHASSAAINLEQVSCLSATTCVAVGYDGYAEVLSGTTWSSPASVANGDSITALSCDTSQGYCVLGSFGGLYYLEESSGSYGFTSSVQPLGNGDTFLQAVACVDTSCFAVSQANTVYYGSS